MPHTVDGHFARCYICALELDIVRSYDRTKNSWKINMGCPRCKIVWSGELLLDMESVKILMQKNLKQDYLDGKGA